MRRAAFLIALVLGGNALAQSDDWLPVSGDGFRRVDRRSVNTAGWPVVAYIVGIWGGSGVNVIYSRRRAEVNCSDETRREGLNDSQSPTSSFVKVEGLGNGYVYELNAVCEIGRKSVAQTPSAPPSSPASTYPARIDTGVAGGMRIFIERSSVYAAGTVIRFKTTGQSSYPGESEPLQFLAEVAVDCNQRRRIEYASVRWRGNGQRSNVSASSPEMRSVFEGTREARELDLACAVAAGLPLVGSGPPVQAVTPTPKVEIPQTPPTPQRTRVRSTGSGFAVGASDIIVTNYHVVEDCSRVVALRDGEAYETKQIAADAAADLAALKVFGLRVPTIPVSTVPEELGGDISVLGFPLTSVLGNDLRITTGVVSSLSGPKGERRLMQISAAVQPGNSGGPVVDQWGSVQGVVVSKLARKFDGENVNFAVRAPVLRSFLEVNGIPFQAVKRGSPVRTSEIARRLARSVVLLTCY